MLLDNWYRVRTTHNASYITQDPKSVELPFIDIKRISADEITKDEIIQILQEEAENANYHSFISIYTEIDTLLQESLHQHKIALATSNDVRNTFFHKLAEKGGLIT